LVSQILQLLFQRTLADVPIEKVRLLLLLGIILFE
jgi:hypothetical protein